MREWSWILWEAGEEAGSFPERVGEERGKAFPGGDVVLEDAEQEGELFFEVEQGALGGDVGGEVSEGALEEVVEIWGGRVGLRGGFEELDEIGGGPEVGEGFPDAFVGVAQADLTEAVQIGFSGGCKSNFAVKKEVDPA